MLPGKYLTDVDSPIVGRKQLQESMSVLPTMLTTVSVLQYIIKNGRNAKTLGLRFVSFCTLGSLGMRVGGKPDGIEIIPFNSVFFSSQCLRLAMDTCGPCLVLLVTQITEAQMIRPEPNSSKGDSLSAEGSRAREKRMHLWSDPRNQISCLIKRILFVILYLPHKEPTFSKILFS